MTFTVTISPDRSHEITLNESCVTPLNIVQVAAVADILGQLPETIDELILFDTFHGHVLRVGTVSGRMSPNLIKVLAKRDCRWIEFIQRRCAFDIGLPRGI